MDHADDSRLIDECRNGRTAAYGELVRRYQDRLFNAVFRLLDHPEVRGGFDPQATVRERDLAHDLRVALRREVDLVTRNRDQGVYALDGLVMLG